MKAALAKEFRLVVHPSTYVLALLGALVLIPTWMYGAIFIYGVLVAFFNGMNAREMRDMSYSFSLPMSRREMVRARIGAMMAIEAVMIAIMLVFVLLREPLGINAVAAGQDLVGMPANLFLVGFGLAIFGVFNAFFYPLYYRNPMKVGVPFMVACIPAAVVLVVLEALPYLPFPGCALFATVGMGNAGAQLAGLAVGAVVFAAGSLIAMRLAERSFSTYDA